jgi:hypothetical protein
MSRAKDKCREGSSFFEKKEAKKLFSHETRWGREPAPNGKSFFASFCSQKEESYLPFPSGRAA